MGRGWGVVHNYCSKVLNIGELRIFANSKVRGVVQPVQELKIARRFGGLRVSWRINSRTLIFCWKLLWD